MYYCSKECQVEDWKKCHKHECRHVKKMVETKSSILDDCQDMMYFRFCIKTLDDEDISEKVWNLFDGSERKIDDFVDHVQDMKENTPERFSTMVSFAKEIMKLDIGLNLETVLKRCGQVKINSFAIQNELSGGGNEVIGYGLFMDASNINHSCRSNAVRVFDGSTMEIRAWRDIDTNVEEVTLSYINCQEPREQRKQSLRQYYYFDCQCEWCATETDWERDCQRLLRLVNELPVALALRKRYEMNSKYGEIRDIVRKSYGEYHMIFVQLLRNQLEALLLQQRMSNERPSLISKKLFVEFKLQASVIYGPEHTYTQHFVKRFRSLK